MKIANMEIIPVVLPKEDPEWRFALGGEAEAKAFIIKLVSDEGISGIGYAASAMHHGISFGGVQAALEAYRDPLIGQDPFDIEKIY